MKKLPFGETVEVYRNLRDECFSVRHKGRVVAHAEAVLLTHCKLVVREAGRQKVLETGHKNVHAFVRGTLSMIPDPAQLHKQTDKDFMRKIRYNPYECGSFTMPDLDSAEISWAQEVLCADSKCYAKQ